MYFSVVTFTTLGYGDMAALEALTGYLVLGTLVSTSLAIIDPRSEVGAPTEEEGE